MSSYYVTHPNLGISAVVDAPATEKARTTFLDWLERTGQITRGDRQRWRRNMVAERLEDPGEVMADVELHYGYEEAGGYRRPDVVDIPIGIDRPEIVDIPMDIDEPEVIDIPVELKEEQPPNLSPIARVSLGGRLT